MNGANFGQAQPPWQLWGNTMVLTVQGSTFVAPNTGDVNQTLCRVSYGRPETWRFLFAAKLLSAPAMPVGKQANVGVWFDVLVGIGRAAVKIPFFMQLPSWTWASGASAPINLTNWATHTTQQSTQAFVSLEYGSGSDTLFGNVQVPTDLLPGQDITVTANSTFNTDLALPQVATVEVSCLLSPNNHVRPDWMLMDKSPAEQFPGGEVGGR